MAKLSLYNESTDKTYEVVRFDKETGMITLKGPNAEFSEKYDADKFRRMGYVLRKET